MKEHGDACEKATLEKSVTAEHEWKNHHPGRWEETSIVDRARRPKELMLKEALHILLRSTGVGLELPDR